MRVRGYEVLGEIGFGGQSRVYRAHQPDLDRDVAIKVLTVDRVAEAERRAFERECQALGVLSSHPNIVTIFNAEYTDDGRPCLVMEYYSGGTLAERMKRDGALDVRDVVAIGVELAGALDTAHHHGVFHRDIKPQNLFVSEFGVTALGDFGISTFQGERTELGSGALTVHYAAPELVEGASATAASDVYSLAASLYTLIAGRRPFEGGPGQTIADVARRILHEPAPPLVGDGLPAGLADLMAEALAKNPAARPDSAAAFGARLQQVQADSRWRVTPLVSAAGVMPGPGPEAVRAAVIDGGGADASAADASPWPSMNHRRLTSAALAVLAVVALVSTAVALTARRDGTLGDSGAPRPSTTLSVADDPYLVRPDAPTEVSVRRRGEAAVAVSWQPVGSDARSGVSVVADRTPVTDYEVTPVDGTGTAVGESVTTGETGVVLELDPAGNGPFCVVIRAVTADGRRSAPTAPVCLDVDTGG